MSRAAQLPPRSLLTPILRQVIRFVLAPLALSFSGFHIMDFLLSGAYSWPRSSRILVLILATIILSHEFVYKEHIHHMPAGSQRHSLKVILSSCIIPFMIGSLALLGLVALSH